LDNGRLGLSFDEKTGTLTAIQNKLTGETYAVRDDLFEVEATDFRVGQADARLVALERQPGTLKASYEAGPLTIEVAYTLRGENHFAEKQLTLTSNRGYGLKKVVLGRPSFSAPDLRLVPYRYPKFERKPGEEPTCTFFGRTPKGGLFTGVEVPFDASALNEQQVTLSYAPSLKVAAGEKLACEPAYFGVYRRGPHDREEKDMPLWSESEAMVALTSAVLSPPRFGLVPMACGWHCEMEHAQPALLPAHEERHPRGRQGRNPQVARLGTEERRLPQGPQGPPRLAGRRQGGRLGTHPRRSRPGLPLQLRQGPARGPLRPDRREHWPGNEGHLPADPRTSAIGPEGPGGLRRRGPLGGPRPDRHDPEAPVRLTLRPTGIVAQ
jgi:hypothetical protein